MKKTLVLLVAVALGMSVTSCKQQGQQTQSEAVETAVEEVVEAAPSSVEMMTSLLEKAKSEGANLSVDEWKDLYKQSFALMVPHILKSAEFEKAVLEGKADSIENPENAEAIENGKKEFAALTPILEELTSIMESFPNGKAVLDDKEFGKGLIEEFQIPEAFQM